MNIFYVHNRDCTILICRIIEFLSKSFKCSKFIIFEFVKNYIDYVCNEFIQLIIYNMTNFWTCLYWKHLQETDVTQNSKIIFER